MELNFQYHVVQYVEKTYSSKRRNVAIIGTNGLRFYFRALGVTEDKIEPAYFQSIAGKTKESKWVYREWVNWLQDLIQLKNQKQFNEAITRLKSSISGFVVPMGGSIEINGINADFSITVDMLYKQLIRVPEEGSVLIREINTDFSTTMDRLFKKLIRVPRISPAIEFENRVEDILGRSEIVFEKGFLNEPAEVEMVDEESKDVVTLEFSHLMTGDRPIGFNTLVLQGDKQKSLSERVGYITDNFKNAVRTGFLERDRCVLLCGRVPKKHQGIIDQLSGIATVIDVFDESTTRKIRELGGLYNLFV